MIINGKFYKDAELDFNTVCEMENMGVSIQNIDDNIMSAARAYAAICMHKPLRIAGTEIEAHIINGGTLADILEPFNKKAEESGFFQALRRKAQAEESQEENKVLEMKPEKA